ncbi:MAG: GerAB/ArcD/ProY family transporter [Firmicutes bacterium]|nr:GerAB/ArcD/ProY family transporter [Bacillota bacterium]
MRYEISWWQVTAAIIAVQISFLVTFTPALTSSLPPVRESWLAVFISALAAGIIVAPVHSLAQRFPEQTVYEISRAVLGRYAGTVFNLLLTAMFVLWAAIAVRGFSLFLVSVVFVRTPQIVFVVCFLILALVGAREGFEFIGRISEMAAFLALVGLGAYYAIALPNADLGLLGPVLAEGWMPLLRQSLAGIGVFGETAIVGLLALPYLNRPSESAKALAFSLLLSAALVAAGAGLLVAILGPEGVALSAMPALTAARIVTLGFSLERLEWLLLVLWITTLGVRLTVLFFGACLGVSAVLPRLTVPAAAWPVAAVMLVLASIVQPTMPDVLNFFRPESYLRYALPFELAPALLLLIALLRGGQSTQG